MRSINPGRRKVRARECEGEKRLRMVYQAERWELTKWRPRLCLVSVTWRTNLIDAAVPGKPDLIL